MVARKATPQWLRNFAVSLPTGPSRLHLSAQLQKALLILPAVHGSPRPKNIHWSTIIHCFAEDHLIQKCCNYLRWFPCRNGGMTWKTLIKAAIARLDPAVQVEGTFQKGHDFLWKSSISLAKAKIWELPMMIWQEEYRRFYDWTSFILQFNMKILNC